MIIFQMSMVFWNYSRLKFNILYSSYSFYYHYNWKTIYFNGKIGFRATIVGINSMKDKTLKAKFHVSTIFIFFGHQNPDWTKSNQSLTKEN